VARSDDPDLPALLDAARAAGVGDRVHVAPYVDPFAVPAYLADASAGLIPLLHHPNHELSLVTKWYEYAQAGLPLIVSDVRAMAAETRRLGVGAVFVAGDPSSFVEASREVLAAPERYRAAWKRDPQLLDELSWERQADRLLAVYRRLGCTP
jgi:glycosyltransferase involved in cell wall biosynthesis